MSELQERSEGAVRVLTFARPPGNTLTTAFLESLRARVQSAGRQSAVRALVLESSVDGYFSSGMDLAELLSLPAPRRGESFQALVAAYRALLSFEKPCVAALSGSALLGGWVLAMACDWRVLGARAKISLAEIRVGLTPTPALIARLSQLCADPRVVKEMVLRGRSLNAEDALAAGLVDEVRPEEETRAAALAAAGKLAKSAPRAFSRIKAALNASACDAALWDRSVKEFSDVFAGAEAREGLAAFRDKRRARWEGA
ncbi:MAG: enoyl-CoA hydratase/isomerase family protein [Elusimicrobia bacterium]|nr:enoyl-CoA hydratase/isomerase family protein [Elusimicrobiota bacterium]